MQSYQAAQQALLFGLFLEHHDSPDFFSPVAYLKDKYGIDFQFNWNDQILYTHEACFIERRTIKGFPAYRVRPATKEKLRAALLASTMSTIIKVNSANKVLHMDGAIPKALKLPTEWQIVDAASDKFGETDLSEIDEHLAMIDQSISQSVDLNLDQSETYGALESIQNAAFAVGQSNSFSLDFKREMSAHLNAGIQIMTNSRKVAVGALKFLLIDRLAEAYKEATEDVLKNIIKVALYAVIFLVIAKLK
jgi:hypothetical protein